MSQLPTNDAELSQLIQKILIAENDRAFSNIWEEYKQRMDEYLTSYFDEKKKILLWRLQEDFIKRRTEILVNVIAHIQQDWMRMDREIVIKIPYNK